MAELDPGECGQLLGSELHDVRRIEAKPAQLWDVVVVKRCVGSSCGNLRDRGHQGLDVCHPVIRRWHRADRVGTDRLGMPGQFFGIRHGVVAHLNHDRNPSCHRLQIGCRHPLPLVGGH